jgi:hypothetical protein
MENLIEYKISKHAEERYAERIMGKEGANNINRFIAENKEKISQDIHKMIRYGDLIFTGKQSQKDGKGNVLNVYIKDCWVVLVDNKSEVVVTLYKIDLGLGDDFNKTYITKMMDRLNESKVKLEEIQLEVLKESTMYKELADDVEAQINEYKSMIKHLEELHNSYKNIIENSGVKVLQANRDVAEVVNKLVGKKEF